MRINSSHAISVLFLFGTFLALLILAHAAWVLVASFLLAHEWVVLALEVAHHQLLYDVVL